MWSSCPEEVLLGVRQERISDQIKEEISRMLLREIRDPRIGFVTITGTSVSPDLRNARVFVSVLGAPEVREDSLRALNSAAGFLRRSLFKRLRLRHSPVLEFVLDDSLDRGERIERLLDDIHRGETPTNDPGDEG
jgi:ribosome-binding factor A